LNRRKQGNYGVEESAFKKTMTQNGEKEILFASDVQKVNQKLVSQKRMFVITDKGVYNLHPSDMKVKRRIGLDEIDSVTVTPYADNIFCIHMPQTYDYLYDSEKKTEIIEVLSATLLKYYNKKLGVKVSDKFDFSPNKGEFKSITVLSDDRPGDTSISEGSGGITIRSRYDPPSVEIESAYMYTSSDSFQKPTDITQSKLVRLKKRETYKLELRLHTHKHLQACSIHEKIDTMSARQEFVTQVKDLPLQDDCHTVSLSERKTMHSLLSKTQVKVEMMDPTGKVLMSLKFSYEVK
jgi:myosin-1